METKINPTPTLKGIDAERFIERLNTSSSKEELESLKRADETFKNIKFVR